MLQNVGGSKCYGKTERYQKKSKKCDVDINSIDRLQQRHLITGGAMTDGGGEGRGNELFLKLFFTVYSWILLVQVQLICPGL